MESLGGLLRDLAHEGRTVLFSSHQLDLVEDLCEDVVTIHRGQIVMQGRLEDLRAAARHRSVEIDLTHAADGWLPTIPGADVLERSNGHVRLLVDRTVDLAGLARLAEDAGEVLRFDFEPPHLSDLPGGRTGAMNQTIVTLARRSRAAADRDREGLTGAGVRGEILVASMIASAIAGGNTASANTARILTRRGRDAGVKVANRSIGSA